MADNTANELRDRQLVMRLMPIINQWVSLLRDIVNRGAQDPQSFAATFLLLMFPHLEDADAHVSQLSGQLAALGSLLMPNGSLSPAFVAMDHAQRLAHLETVIAARRKAAATVFEHEKRLQNESSGNDKKYSLCTIL